MGLEPTIIGLQPIALAAWPPTQTVRRLIPYVFLRQGSITLVCLTARKHTSEDTAENVYGLEDKRIHILNLQLLTDLEGFEPPIYSLLQMRSFCRITKPCFEIEGCRLIFPTLLFAKDCQARLQVLDLKKK